MDILYFRLQFLNTYYLKFRGIDAKLSKPVQFLNAAVPEGVGFLNQSVGALPSKALDVVDILYTLSNEVTDVFAVNCCANVNAKQFLNVDEKLVTFGEVLNKLTGYEFNKVHELNADAKVFAFVELSNNPAGIAVIDVNENISLNVVADVEKSKISAGIVVIPVPLIKPAKDIILFNPLYPTSIVPLAGIEVILVHPLKSKVLKPTLPKSTIPVISERIAALLLTLIPGIEPNISIV